MNFEMKPNADCRPWKFAAHEQARQRLGVRWPSTAFEVPGTHPKRQRSFRTGTGRTPKPRGMFEPVRGNTRVGMEERLG
jgi:hypothetical protein